MKDEVLTKMAPALNKVTDRLRWVADLLCHWRLNSGRVEPEVQMPPLPQQLFFSACMRIYSGILSYVWVRRLLVLTHEQLLCAV